MDKMVVQYLPKAFAFVYVINSANAGGIQKDRVSILILFCRFYPYVSHGRLVRGRAKASTLLPLETR